MKKLSFINGLLAALLLVSPMVGAKQTEPPGFEPVIIYQDTDYIAKHSQSSAASEPGRYSQSKAAPASTERAVASKPEKSAAQAGDSSSQYLVGLIILALGGFIFWNSKQSSSAASSEQRVAPVAPVHAAAGDTGVAKYLKSIGAGPETGVAKYLKSVEATAKSAVVLTGVAKYLKNQEASAK